MKKFTRFKPVGIGGFIFYITLKKGFEFGFILFSKGRNEPLLNNKLSIKNMKKQLKLSNLLNNILEFYVNNINQLFEAFVTIFEILRSLRLWRSSMKRKDVIYNWKLILCLWTSLNKVTKVLRSNFSNLFFVFTIFEAFSHVRNVGKSESVFQLLYKYYLFFLTFLGFICGILARLLLRFRWIIDLYHWLLNWLLFFLILLFLRLTGEGETPSIQELFDLLYSLIGLIDYIQNTFQNPPSVLVFAPKFLDPILNKKVPEIFQNLHKPFEEENRFLLPILNDTMINRSDEIPFEIEFFSESSDFKELSVEIFNFSQNLEDINLKE